MNEGIHFGSTHQTHQHLFYPQDDKTVVVIQCKLQMHISFKIVFKQICWSNKGRNLSLPLHYLRHFVTTPQRGGQCYCRCCCFTVVVVAVTLVFWISALSKFIVMTNNIEKF